jgi:hypothetical protein
MTFRRPASAAHGAQLAGPSGARSAPSTLTRLAPILLFLGYLNVSVLVFLFGPWHWPLIHPTKFYLFIVAAHAALGAGYLSGAFGAPRSYSNRFSPEKIAWYSVIVTLLLYVPTMIWLTDGDVDLQSVLEPGFAYNRYQERFSFERPTHPVSYIRTILGPLLAMAVPIVFFYWERMSRSMRLLGVLAAVANLSVFVFTGKNRGMADVVIFTSIIAGLRIGAGKLKISPWRALQSLVVIAVLLTAFNAFYTRNVLGRTGGRDTSSYVDILGGMYADEDNVLLSGIPEPDRLPIRSLSFNYTHGYYALYLALDMPFESAFPVGHSFAVQTQERRLLGTTELADHSYTNRLHNAGLWHKTLFWHTTYVWLASDVSFPGVIVLLFVLGRLAARSWLEAILTVNPFAVAMFTTIATMIIYFPANNIILGFPESYTAFWVILVMWRFTAQRSAATSDVREPDALMRA